MFVFPSCRGRNKGPIGPGKYGYGKVPYILPLQTDTGQSPQKPRRQRQLKPQTVGSLPVDSAHHHGSLYQEGLRPQPRAQVTNGFLNHQPVPAFPASPHLFHGEDLSVRVPVSHQATHSQPPSQRTAAIVCTGAYKQHKLCNTNVSSSFSVTTLGKWAGFRAVRT